MSDELTAAPPAEPLFVLDLEANGGVLAPTSVEALSQWLEDERTSWAWLNSTPGGPHRKALDASVGRLGAAWKLANGAKGHPPGSEAWQLNIKNAEVALRDAFVSGKLPHST